MQLHSTALWKHITWRCDPSTLSCHSTLSTLSDLQGRRCCSWPATESHLTIIGFGVLEKVLLVIEVSPSRRRRSAKPGGRRGPRGAQKVLWGIQKRGCHGNAGTLIWGHEAEKCLQRVKRLWGSWICKSVEIWFKATGFTFYILVWGSMNRSLTLKYSNVAGRSSLLRYSIHFVHLNLLVHMI